VSQVKTGRLTASLSFRNRSPASEQLYKGHFLAWRLIPPSPLPEQHPGGEGPGQPGWAGPGRAGAGPLSCPRGRAQLGTNTDWPVFSHDGGWAGERPGGWRPATLDAPRKLLTVIPAAFEKTTLLENGAEGVEQERNRKMQALGNAALRVSRDF